MIDVSFFQELIYTFAICITRMTAACFIAPFMSKQVVPAHIRTTIVVSWGFIVYPMVAPTIDLSQLDQLERIGIVVKEVFLGMLIGLMAARVFWIAMSVGFFIDNQRGASMASVFDPTIGDQTSPVGLFLEQAMIALFYVSGGMLVFLSALFESYLVWPVGSFSPQLDDAFPGFFLELFDTLSRTIVVLAAPVIISMLLATFGLGLMNRFAPQLNVFFLAMPVKSLIALVVLIVYIPFLFEMMKADFTGLDILYDHFNRVVQ